MAQAPSTGAALRVLVAFAVPWDAFVAAFLYYTLLTLIVLAGLNLPALFVGVAYLLPAGAYAGWLAVRAVHALAALPIDLGETPHALQH